ncbi:MAG: hypothetical protein AABM42_06935 [Actinomycetota bacterium]
MADYCEHGYARGGKRCPQCRPRVRDRIKQRISRYSRGGSLVVGGAADVERRERPLGSVDVMTGEWTPPPGTRGLTPEEIEVQGWDFVAELDPRTGARVSRPRNPWL